MKNSIQVGQTYKHTGTGEIIFIAGKAKNHFHGSDVIIYESSFAPAEYHYMLADSEHWTFFEPCDEKELENWYCNYRENINLKPIYYATSKPQ